MFKIRMLGVALVAVFAFGAVAAASAVAAPEWLVEEVKPAAALPSETEGKLTLVKLISSVEPGILNEVECSGYLVGTVAPGAEDTITGALNLDQETISNTPLTGLPFECNVTFDAGAAADCLLNSTALVWPENLPWSTEAVLVGEQLVDLLFGAAGKEPAYDVECTTKLGFAGSELCESNTEADISNNMEMPMGVFGEFLPSAPEANCTLTGAKTGQLVGTGTTWAVGGTVAAPVYLERLDTLIDD